VLLLLAEQSMHGYQLIQEIKDRTHGVWQPSPGAVYPALQLLEDEGLVQITKDGGRNLASLTTAGREYVEANRQRLGDPFATVTAGAGTGGRALLPVFAEVLAAATQVARSGTDGQVEQARRLLVETRRALYLILAEGEDGPATPTGMGTSMPEADDVDDDLDDDEADVNDMADEGGPAGDPRD
jgi:DNA-binding PadR family transcriptional regulator